VKKNNIIKGNTKEKKSKAHNSEYLRSKNKVSAKTIKIES